MFLLLSLCRYLCWRTISPEGIIHHMSVFWLTWFIRYLCFYYYHLVRYLCWRTIKGIIHTLVSILKVIPLYFISMFLLLSLCRYLCWRTISLRGYHPHISQYFDFKRTESYSTIFYIYVFITITVSIPLLEDY